MIVSKEMTPASVMTNDHDPTRACEQRMSATQSRLTAPPRYSLLRSRYVCMLWIGLTSSLFQFVRMQAKC